MSLKLIKKTVIFTGYRCNNHCRFCMESNKRKMGNVATAKIKEQMINARQRGTDYLELIGGEMTIRPDIIELISFAKSLGFPTIMMSTNGRMFSYKDLVRRMLQAGLNSIVFSIHGHNAKLHDYLTRVPGSFRQLKKGIKNTQEVIQELNLTNVSLGSNTTIVKPNYKYLLQIGEYIYHLGLRNAEFIFVDCNEGGSYDDFDQLIPRISKVAPYMHECLDIGKIHKIAHWHVRYVPLCYFINYLDQISELQEVEMFHTEHIAQDFYDFNVEENRKNLGRSKTKKCQGCKLFNQCEGIWKEYLKNYGDAEFRPIK